MGVWAPLRELFSPPVDVGWFLGLAWTALVVLAAAAMFACWPRPIPGPLTARESRAARVRGPARIAAVAPLTIWAACALLGLVVLLFGPRWRYEVVYQTRRDAEQSAGWAGPPRAGWSGPSRLDPAPLVARVVNQARRAGAGCWDEPTRTRRDWLRALCLATLTDAPLPTPPSGVAADCPTNAGEPPRWVVESVELSIVAGLVARDNVRTVAVRVDPDERPPWEQARRSLATPRTSWAAIDSAPESPARVRQLFDARIKDDGTLTARVLVQGRPGAAAAEPLVVFDAKGQRLAAAPVPGTLATTAAVVSVTLAVPMSQAVSPLRLTAERGAVRTSIAPRDPPPTTVAVTGAHAAGLVAMAQAVASDKAIGLRPALQALGRPEVTLSVQPRAPGEPAVVADDRFILVVGPNLEPADVQLPSGRDSAPPGAGTGAHVSFVAGEAPTAWSWMSIGLRAEVGSTTPYASPSARPIAGGVLMNQPLDAGRALALGQTAVGRPVVEVGEAGGRTFVAFRVDPREQGLAWPSAAPPPATHEPARARAFLLSLAWAVQRVGNPPAPTLDDAPGAGPLFTRDDLDACTRSGLRATESVGLALLAASLGALLLQVWLWSRDPRRARPHPTARLSGASARA